MYYIILALFLIVFCLVISNYRDNILEGINNTIHVQIIDYTYTPNPIKIQQGTTVIWTNKDTIGHTVTSDVGKFLNSVLLEEGDTYKKTFDKKGRYKYYCTVHSYMKGEVIVS